tara:strand:+ start:258 stop:479 length:222 start_codon:yes stop_codon:yes gene_type:complete
LYEGYIQFVYGKEIIVLGEMDSYNQIKKLVLSRMGLKYYFMDIDSSSKHNTFIDANLRQANFSELMVGLCTQI